MAAPAPADEDLYAILGASIDSTDDELKKAYRALAIKVTCA
jgi:curved DNA-binding protein CbpA